MAALASSFWMRPVSFAGLLQLVRLIAAAPEGLSAAELEEAIRARGVPLTRRTTRPARTTLYHYRNTLVRLGIVHRGGGRLVASTDDPNVRVLVEEALHAGPSLSPVARDAFSELVLRNDDCRRHFFDLFMPGAPTYGLRQFRADAQPVTWRPSMNGPLREIILQGRDGPPVRLRLPSEVKSILYGVRYWARDQLKLVDEFFRPGRGAVVYPISNPDDASSVSQVTRHILSFVSPEDEWTSLSLVRLAEECCEMRRQPLTSLLSAISHLCARYPGYVVLIPTSRSFAALTASSLQREDFELRGYYRDREGRYISHVRLHNSLGRMRDVTIS